RARKIFPETSDAFVGPIQSAANAMTLAWLGDKDAAVSEIERLTKKPGFLQVWEITTDVAWLPLRGNPRFEAILADPKNRAPFVDDDNRQVDPYAGGGAAPVTFTVPGVTTLSTTPASFFALDAVLPVGSAEKSVAVLPFENLS